MRIGELRKRFPPALETGMERLDDRDEICGLTHRNRELRNGYAYVSFRGDLPPLDPKRLILSKVPLPTSNPNLVYPNLEEVSREVALAVNEDILKNTTLVAVTGTNGKSTTVEFAAQLHRRLAPEKKAATLGTLGLSVEGYRKSSPNTTPFPLDFQAALREAHSRSSRVLFFEASSHALSEDRLKGLKIEHGAFTNITEDHLDYHKKRESYIGAKLKLLPLLGSSAVINRDCPVLGDVQHDGIRICGVTLANRDTGDALGLRLKDCVPDEQGFNGTLCDGTGAAFPFRLHAMGDFNLHNMLCAAGLLYCMGFTIGQTAPLIESLRPPVGRFESVPLNLPGRVLIDYAHTSDALKRALGALRLHFPGKRLRVLFGCGGDRDRGKRPTMGEIAGKLADEVWVTSDNPRSEEPSGIIDEILTGLHATGARLNIEADRKKAIHAALASQLEDDVLLLTGKGHEMDQDIAGHKKDFDERQICREFTGS